MTDIHQLVSADELAEGNYERLVGTNARMWVPNAGKPRKHAEIQSGWARVLAIGAPVSLGEGIDAPTLAAAPVMAVFVTTQSDLYTYQLDSNAELAMTATHPVWCETHGGWVQAGELKPGDRIRIATGQACIGAIRLAQTGATVYNLSIAVVLRSLSVKIEHGCIT